MDRSSRRRKRVVVAVSFGVVVTMGPTACSTSSAPTPTSTNAPQASSSARSSVGSDPASAEPVGALFGSLPIDDVDAVSSRKFQQVLDKSVGAGNPAVLAAVLTPQGSWAGAAGVDGPAGRKATPRDIWAIASISKTFTAALILKLVEAGKINLDEPLSTYLGAVKVDTNGATVRQALAMRSGLPDTPGDALAKVNASPQRVWTTAEVIGAVPSAIAVPGAAYNYSNPTYKLLGLAAEEVTGAPFAEVMRSEVLDPANSPTSLLVQTAASSTPKPWALPIRSGDLTVAQYGAGGALPSVSDATFSLAASSMAGDALGVASWAWQLFAGKVVSKDSLAVMARTDAAGNGLGLDKFGDFGTTVAYGHTGSKPGYQSLLVVFPERQEVVVVGVTQRDADVTKIAADLLAASAP